MRHQLFYGKRHGMKIDRIIFLELQCGEIKTVHARNDLGISLGDTLLLFCTEVANAKKNSLETIVRRIEPMSRDYPDYYTFTVHIVV